MDARLILFLQCQLHVLLIIWMSGSWAKTEASPISNLGQGLNTDIHTHTHRKTLPLSVIEYLHLQSNIQFRYAKTGIFMQVINPAPEAQSLTFNIPVGGISNEKSNNRSGGFISEAKMEINGKTFIAKLKSSQDAEVELANLNAHASANSSGLIIRSLNGELTQFELMVQLGSRIRAKITLIYEERIRVQKSEVKFSYDFKLSVKPTETYRIENFKVALDVSEHAKPIGTRIFIPNYSSPNCFKIRNQNRSLDERGTISLECLLSKEELLKSNSTLQVIAQFDFPNDLSDREVLAQDGYFIHFAPGYHDHMNITRRPLHTVFVLDISGSMAGVRLQQLKDGMYTILDELNEDDYLDIITFSTEIQEWSPLPPKTSPFKAEPDYKANAREFVENLVASGGTNIFGALKQALVKIKNIRLRKSNQLLPQSVIFFLTDGYPTARLTNRTEILRRLKLLNANMSIPIFPLAFGTEVDRPLCDEIAKDHNGFVRQIVDMRNCSALITGFYEEIATLVGNKISIKNIRQDTGMQSKSLNHGIFQNGSAFKADIDPNKIAIVVDVGPCQQYMSGGQVNNDMSAMNEAFQKCWKSQTKKIHDGSSFLEKLWAFMETRDLSQRFHAEKLQCPEKVGKYYGGQESLPVSLTRMSLHYSFITPCASLVLTANE